MQRGDRFEQLYLEKSFFVKCGDRFCKLRIYYEKLQYSCNVMNALTKFILKFSFFVKRGDRVCNLRLHHGSVQYSCTVVTALTKFISKIPCELW